MIFQGNDLSFKIHTNKYMGLFGGLNSLFMDFVGGTGIMLKSFNEFGELEKLLFDDRSHRSTGLKIWFRLGNGLGMVYSPTNFPQTSSIAVGKYTSPMDSSYRNEIISTTL